MSVSFAFAHVVALRIVAAFVLCGIVVTSKQPGQHVAAEVALGEAIAREIRWDRRAELLVEFFEVFES